MTIMLFIAIHFGILVQYIVQHKLVFVTGKLFTAVQPEKKCQLNLQLLLMCLCCIRTWPASKRNKRSVDNSLQLSNVEFIQFKYSPHVIWPWFLLEELITRKLGVQKTYWVAWMVISKSESLFVHLVLRHMVPLWTDYTISSLLYLIQSNIYHILHLTQFNNSKF